MLDRVKVETLLKRRFANARSEDVRAAADAIMGWCITNRWQEVLHPDQEFGYHSSACCSDNQAAEGQDVEFRILQRRNGHIVACRRRDDALVGVWEDAWR